MSPVFDKSLSPDGSARAAGAGAGVGQRLAGRPRSLTRELVEQIESLLRSGAIAPGEKLPTESALMRSYGVSRTVVREALASLQASGRVRTRHGIGTFALELLPAPAFFVTAQQRETLHEIIATLELRRAVECEAAALAAQRRTDAQLQTLHQALLQLDQALHAGQDSSAADYAFHLALAHATHNARFVDLSAALGVQGIPRARLGGDTNAWDAATPDYLWQVQAEHVQIFQAVRAQAAEQAHAAMWAHLSRSLERRRQALQAAGVATHRG